MDNLRLFSTETEYNTSKSGFEYPTVSYVESNDTVYYMTLREKYTNEYLTFEALEDGTFTLTIPANVDSTYMTSVSYSTDNGETWTDTVIDNTAQTITTPTINAGDKVLWKGVGKQMTKSTYDNNFSYFSSTGNFNVSGNIMSLLYGDEFANQVVFPSGSTYNFCSLFRYNNKLISVENLILPATTLKNYCYNYMFNGCAALITAPELPATTLAKVCYTSMFFGCRSLTTAPELPATTLAMSCYQNMFNGCSNLNYIKAMFTTTPATSYTSNWVKNVASTGTFVKNSAAQWDVSGVHGVPTGWTVETASA